MLGRRAQPSVVSLLRLWQQDDAVLLQRVLLATPLSEADRAYSRARDRRLCVPASQRVCPNVGREL